ncbi:uncharacterized protein rab11fip5a isoform X3 [Engraulis encrasicolus]|uniref:uncharacterized protein rab11fip5a isoform X3 n=1 Tax=Engraulis encrasicolus TaxID=184585 RepID=UPI002FD6B75E
MSSAITDDEQQRWVPTHVQVTVLRARGIRAKGKHGTSDAYVIIQVGKEKYSTCVMEKTTDPEWGEECSFELQWGVLEPGGRDVCPPGSCDLTLTAMHRALIGLDVFLGQAVIPLDKAFQDRKSMKKEWHRLHSKSGKKEKERGEVQVTVQFTRHNLTASMYDLSIKDKPHSAFGKLKERIRGGGSKKRVEASTEDSASAIIPGGYGALARMRGRLPSDGGGEEYYEDDEGGEARRSKMRTFFLRGRLRKSSDTRSSTSLGSESSESSSRGGSLSPTAGISVVVSDLSNSPSNSSNLTADNSPEHTVAPSPQVSPVRRAFGDDVCEISIPVPQSFTYDNLITDTGVSTSTTTITTTTTALANGHPVKHAPGPHGTKSGPQQQQHPNPKQVAQLAKPKPKALSLALSPAVGSLQKGSAISLSLQNLTTAPRQVEEPPLHAGPGDGRRWSLDKAGEEERAAIAAAIESAGKLEDEERLAAQLLKKEAAGEGEVKKQKWGLFSHSRSESSGKSGTTTGKGDVTSGPSEGKHKGWFGSKDSHSKPSSVPTTMSIFDSSNGQECHGTEDNALGDGNDVTLTQEVTVVSQEGVFFNPFMTDFVGAQPGKPGGDLQTVNNIYQDTNGVTNGVKLLGISQLSPNISQTSLPQDVYIEFNELHKLACPHPRLLSDQTDMQSHTETGLNEASPQPRLLSEQTDMQSHTETGLNETSSIQKIPHGSKTQLAVSAPSWPTTADQSPEMSSGPPPEKAVPEPTGLESALSSLEIDFRARREEADLVLVAGLPPLSAVAEVREVEVSPPAQQRMSAYSEGAREEADLVAGLPLSATAAEVREVSSPPQPSPTNVTTQEVLSVQTDCMTQEVVSGHSSSAAGLPLSAAAEVREVYPPVQQGEVSRPAQQQRMSAYSEASSDDTLEASTIVSASPGRELENHPDDDDPLPVSLNMSQEDLKQEQDGELDRNVANDAEMKEYDSKLPVAEADHVFFDHSDTSSKQATSSSAVHSEFESLWGGDVAPFSSGGTTEPLSTAGPNGGSHVLDYVLGTESPFSGSLVCVMASSPSETLISPESRFTGDWTVPTDTKLPSSHMGVLQDMLSKDKNLPTSDYTGTLDAQHQNLFDSAANWPTSLSVDAKANNGVCPFASMDTDAYVSVLSDDDSSVSNAFFSLNSGSAYASGHDSRAGPIKDLLHVPQSTQLFNSLLFESAESENYHSCNSQQRHVSLCSQRSLPLITEKDPMEQLIAAYDLAVKTRPSEDHCIKNEQIHNSGEDSTSQLDFSALSVLTSPPTLPKSMSSPLSSPTNVTTQEVLSVQTDCMTQEVVSGHSSSPLKPIDDFMANITEKDDLLPDDLWKDKVMSEHWPSVEAMVACDPITEPMPNYDFTDGVVPNSDLTPREMPKSALLQEVPAARDGEMNPLVDEGVDAFPTSSDSASAFSMQSGVQELIAFPVDWANFDKLAVSGTTGENKEMSKAGPSRLNNGWVSTSSCFSPMAFDPNRAHRWSVSGQVGSPWSDQSQPDLIEGMCNETPPSSSISQDFVFTHLHSHCPQTDMPLEADNKESLPNLSENARVLSTDGENFPHAVAPLFSSGQSNAWKMEAVPTVRKDLKLTLKHATQSLSPLAASTPAADPFPLPFSATPPALVTSPYAAPSPIASDMIGAPQAVFPQENQQASNQIASPHPVKPLTPPGEERKSESRSVLEKLKSTIHPGRNQDGEKKSLVEGGGSYYHLNHSELVSLLLQRESDLQRERAEFERRGTLLEKREAELRKTRLLIRDLEDYIDRLLVRIMDEKPTLLQVRKTLK